MTVDNPAVLLAILVEQPDMRVYQYRHTHTGDVLYALFPSGQADAMDVSPSGLAACKAATSCPLQGTVVDCQCPSATRRLTWTNPSSRSAITETCEKPLPSGMGRESTLPPTRGNSPLAWHANSSLPQAQGLHRVQNTRYTCDMP
jgi:hypothetical protein